MQEELERCRHCRRARTEDASESLLDWLTENWTPWVTVCDCTDRDFARAHFGCHLRFELAGGALLSHGVCPVCRAPLASVLETVSFALGALSVAVGLAVGRALALRAASQRALQSYLDNKRALNGDFR
jgi:hypothetical protein